VDTVKVNKADLLEALRVNREAHEGIYQEALEGYKETALAQLQKHLADVQRGAMKVISIMLPAPENHTRDYDRVIKMVEMSVDDELELDQTEFAQYVMDDWHWKRQFLASNSSYSATAQASLG
jgi:hypothetical protein